MKYWCVVFVFVLISSRGIGQASSPQLVCEWPELPHFPGGQAAFNQYLQDSIHYPEHEKAHGIEGTVYISFEVANTGKIGNVAVRKGVPGGAGLDSEAVRVIRNMPDWVPASAAGSSTPMLLMLPVKFVLESDPDTIISTANEDTTIYNSAEQMPEFPGGEIEKQKFLQKNLRYPHTALEQGHEGTIYLTYIVEKDGRITYVGVKKGGAPELVEEAIRVVSKFPVHEPGKNAGVPVRVKMVIPIKFALSK